VSKTAVVTTDCGSFFDSMVAAKSRVLVVDYDGTVAPFCADRRRAFPYPAVSELLGQIMATCDTRLIVISGRSVSAVAPLLGLTPTPEIWGTYGIERLHVDGRYEGPEVTDEALQALEQAEAELEREGLEELIEARPGAVSVHWRGLQPAHVLDVRTKAYSILTPLSFRTGLLTADFDGGVEIRLRSANKGDIARTILNEIGHDVPIAYLGDDKTDEDAFRVLNGRGLTVLVRTKPRFTAAQTWLRPPEELVHFLNMWIRSCGGAA
jgi:trehalose 6-phosphate phosphatase